MCSGSGVSGKSTSGSGNSGNKSAMPPLYSCGAAMRAHGKTVVITGASMGIGEQIAAAFLREGANVVLSSRDLQRTEAARARVGSTERTLAVACDVRKRSDIEK